MAKGKYEYWLTEDGLLLLEAWARDGLTEKQIAAKCGVSERTITDWKRRFSAISAVLKKGKEIIDVEVENALCKRALGYEYDEVKEKYERGVLTERTVTRKSVPPDTTAQIYWLNNRKPEAWRNRREVNVSEDALKKLDGILTGINGVMNDDS